MKSLFNSPRSIKPEMLKVCHITSVHRRDDIRIFVKECCALACNGFEVSLIVADGKGDQVITLEDNISKVNIIDVGIATSRFNRMSTIPQKIFNQIKQIDPDIVHFHDPELMLLGLKLKYHKLKVVYDVHEDLPKQVMSKYWIPKLLRPIISCIVRLVESYVAKRLSGIVCATPIITKRFEHYNANTITICNYPKLSELQMVNTPWNNRDLDLCYIGSISKTRGIEPLVDSLTASGLGLELAGILSGDVKLEGLKQRDAKNLMTYHGVLTRSQIVQLLSRVRIGIVTLLPTPSYIESLPIKLFEYMLAEIPVVASKFDFWQEFVLKYDCGVMVDPLSSEQIADCCTYLVNNPDIAMKMGQNGRKAVVNFFNWETQVKKLVAYYQNSL